MIEEILGISRSLFEKLTDIGTTGLPALFLSAIIRHTCLKIKKSSSLILVDFSRIGTNPSGESIVPL
jgi:hypothetical protein